MDETESLCVNPNLSSVGWVMAGLAGRGLKRRWIVC